jgi:hypothetical protein
MVIECAPDVDPVQFVGYAPEVLSADEPLAVDASASVKVTDENERLVASGLGGRKNGLPESSLNGSTPLI